jgi:hypothetical protein
MICKKLNKDLAFHHKTQKALEVADQKFRLQRYLFPDLVYLSLPELQHLPLIHLQ